MAIPWTGARNWSIWKMNCQKKCSWFSVWMFVLAQGTGRCWDFLSTAMLIYASLKGLPNYSLSLTVRDWLAQNLPVKLWIRINKSVFHISYFFSSCFICPLSSHVWYEVQFLPSETCYSILQESFLWQFYAKALLIFLNRMYTRKKIFSLNLSSLNNLGGLGGGPLLSHVPLALSLLVQRLSLKWTVLALPYFYCPISSSFLGARG